MNLERIIVFQLPQFFLSFESPKGEDDGNKADEKQAEIQGSLQQSKEDVDPGDADTLDSLSTRATEVMDKDEQGRSNGDSGTIQNTQETMSDEYVAITDIKRNKKDTDEKDSSECEGIVSGSVCEVLGQEDDKTSSQVSDLKKKIVQLKKKRLVSWIFRNCAFVKNAAIWFAGRVLRFLWLYGSIR